MAAFGSLPLELVERVASHLQPAAFLALASTSSEIRAALHPAHSAYGAGCFVDAEARERGEARALLLLARGGAVRDRAQNAERVLRALNQRINNSSNLSPKEWTETTFDKIGMPFAPTELWGSLTSLLSVGFYGTEEEAKAVRRVMFFVLCPREQMLLAEALVHLCRRGDTAMLRILLDAGVVSSAAFFADTYRPMRTALVSGHIEIAEMLLPVYRSRIALVGDACTLYHYDGTTLDNPDARELLIPSRRAFPGEFRTTIFGVFNLLSSVLPVSNPDTTRHVLTFSTIALEAGYMVVTNRNTHRDTALWYSPGLSKCTQYFPGTSATNTSGNVNVATIVFSFALTVPIASLEVVSEYAHAKMVSFHMSNGDTMRSTVLDAVRRNDVRLLVYLFQNKLPGGHDASHGPVISDPATVARAAVRAESELRRTLDRAELDSDAWKFLKSVAGIQ
jgi:hypothetical protein